MNLSIDCQSSPTAATGLEFWNLQGKVALVTGAARGLGSTIARGLAEAGAKVAVNYSGSEEASREIVDSIRSGGGVAYAYRADVRDYAQVSTMMKQVATDMGPVDILINNAGVLMRSFLLMMASDDFRKVMDINVMGAFNCTKAAATYMMKRKCGVIVNISSLAGRRGLMGQGAYASSKAALDSLTQISAKEFARYGIRVNAIAPGCIDVGMMKDFSSQTETSYIERIPLGRYGKAQEVTKAVLFLASDLSSYTTGEVLVVDGGMA